MTTDRRPNGLVVGLLIVCLVLAGTTTWALARRGSENGPAAPAAGQELWVSPDGDDSGAGTRDDPFVTLQRGVVLGTGDPVPTSADVTGVQRLSLVVTRGGDGNAFDHADWGDARLDCASD